MGKQENRPENTGTQAHIVSRSCTGVSRDFVFKAYLEARGVKKIMSIRRW